MPFELTGRRALVTGAGHGIGAAIARGLAAAGADVVVHYGHSAAGAEQVASDIAGLGVKAKALQADVTDPAQVDRLIDEATGFLGGLDILVTNAGHLIARVPVADMDEAHWGKVLDVNLGSTYRTVKAALPHLKASGRGRVITMASQAAHDGGGPGAVAYAAAKAGVIGLTKGLAKELGKDGITANALAPGFIGDTAFHGTFTAPEVQNKITGSLPVGRGGVPSDVAGAAVYLASAEAGYLTGTTLDIGGGAWPR